MIKSSYKPENIQLQYLRSMPTVSKNKKNKKKLLYSIESLDSTDKRDSAGKKKYFLSPSKKLYNLLIRK